MGIQELFEIKPIHLRLLRRLNIIWNKDSYQGSPMVYPKKPYGNSDIIGDVVKEMFGKTRDECSKDEITEAVYIHREMHTVLEVVTSSGCFYPGEYRKHKSGNWVYAKFVNSPCDLYELLDILHEEAQKQDPESVEEFKRLDDKDAAFLFHNTIGKNLRNTYYLWDNKSPLHNWFLSHGISHADDMSGIILTSLHRKLKNRDINLNEQIAHYQEYWKKANTFTFQQL